MRATTPLRNIGYVPTRRKLLTVILGSLLTVQLFLAPLMVTPVSIERTATAATPTAAAAPTAIIYDNGPLATGTVARNGSVAPMGSQWSEVSWDFGVTTQSSTLAGVGCQVIGATTSNRCADDFNVPPGQTWTINQVIYFVYQANAAVNPVVGANLRIWNGRPADVGSTIIFGDTTTNRLASSVDSGMFRIFNSGPPNNTATGTTRRLWRVTVNVAPALVVTSGNYWIDFQTDGGAAGNFTPTNTITGTRGAPGWNARQFIGPPTNTGWADTFDDGTPVTAANVPNDFPFKLEGSIAGAPATPTSRTMDFNGDNRSDFVVARSTGAAAQTTWHMLDSAGGLSTTPWGVGVGFAGGDRVTPEDFDGDGKTDIAVWRANPGDPNLSVFYILQSSNNTLRSEQFGKQGDDPSVVDDYDGDGKADLAVFRNSNLGSEPCGGAAVWYWRPSGTPATNFSYACFGAGGDRAYPGDYDGDGRADFSVVRDNAGNGEIYQQRTTAGPRSLAFGLTSDRYVTGDFDGDNRADLAVVRSTGATLSWFFQKSSTGTLHSFVLGASATDYIVPGDYDGDNKTDFALWRSGAGAGNFYLLKSFTSPVQFKFGDSAANLTAPDYPVAAFKVY